nr:hypothetical protein [Tanacetum cinerariifolium]
MNNMATPHAFSMSSCATLADVAGARNNFASSRPSIRSEQSDPLDGTVIPPMIYRLWPRIRRFSSRFRASSLLSIEW